MGMRTTRAHKWPDINVESVNATQRGRDTEHTAFVAQAATKMPCGREIHERTRDKSRSRAEADVKALVKNTGEHHLRKCDTDQCKAKRS